MTGAIWNLLLGLAWVLLSGDFSGLNLLVGLIFGYITLILIEPQLDSLKGYPARVPRFIGFIGFFLKELVQANLRVAFDIVTPLAYEAWGHCDAAFRAYRNGNYSGSQSDFIDTRNVEPGCIR